MVEKRESMEEEESTSSPINKKNSNSDRYPLRLRTPDFSNCHVCDSQINLKSRGGKDKIRTLDSHWRIVIICNSCFINLQSAKTCSYCFTQIHHNCKGVSCRFCNRRIHRDCLSMYGKLNSFNNNVDLDCFTCVDCWVPKSFNKVSCNHAKHNSIEAVNFSPRVLEEPKDKDNSSVSFEDTTVKDAKSNAVKSRKTALGKAAVVRQNMEMAEDVIDIASVTPVLDDAELALRLHRAINSSPRTFRNLKSVKLDKSKMSGRSGNSVSKVSDTENQITSEVELGTDDSIHENTALESFPQIGAIDHGFCNDLGNTEYNVKKVSYEKGKQINCEMVLDTSQAQMSDFRVCILALKEKEQQASFSSKAICRPYFKKTYSRSRCRQNQEGVMSSVENCRGTQSLAELDVDISALEKKSSRESDMFLRKYSRRHLGGSKYIKKYSRRCQGRSKYIKKYSRRNKKLISNLNQTSEWTYATSCLKTESSGTAIPLLCLRNKEELTSNGTSAPSQASTSAGS